MGFNFSRRTKAQSMTAKKSKNVDAVQNQQIKQIKKTLKKIQPELKCKSITFGPTSFYDAAPKITLLNGLLQGDTVDTRSGAEVTAVRLELGLQFYPLTTLPYDAMCRLIVVREKSTLGSLVSLQQLLGSNAPLSYFLRNYENRDANRFHILKDITFPVGTVQYAAASANIPTSNAVHIKNFRINIKLNQKINYSRGNAGDVTDIDTNGIFLICICDSSTVNAMSYRGDCNFHYLDA